MTKKVIILSSDSDYDSVWEDGSESEESDCDSYNKQLQPESHFEKNLSHTTTKEAKTNPGSFFKTPRYVRAMGFCQEVMRCLDKPYITN